MSQLRLNPLTGRWVTIVADRAHRPTDFAPRSENVESDPQRPCPFCPGHEDQSSPAVATVEHDGEWEMRVVANRYPAFDGQERLAVRNMGPVHVMAEASGLHEVFVYSPRHDSSLDKLGDAAAGELMVMLKRRLDEHAKAANVRYSQMILNHGREAGASLAHPHGQLLGLPFVPGEVLDEERAFARFEGGCILCATVEAEIVARERVVFANDDVLCICPFWSGTPYEMLIIPRNHKAHVPESSDDELRAMGRAMRDAAGHLNAALGDASYNLVFHTAPHHHEGVFHWHVHLWPKLVTTAGFERGTGVLINIVPPEAAADSLRQVGVTS